MGVGQRQKLWLERIPIWIRLASAVVMILILFIVRARDSFRFGTSVLIGVAMVTFLCCCMLVLVQRVYQSRGKVTTLDRFGPRRRVLYIGIVVSLLVIMLGLALPTIRRMTIRKDVVLPIPNMLDKTQ